MKSKLSQGPSLAEWGSPATPAVPVVMVPQESSPVAPDDFAAAKTFPPLPEPSEEEDMDTSSSRKCPRLKDSSNDEADAPRKLVLADSSTQEDTTSDRMTSLQSDESDSRQDSLPTSGDASTSPESPT